MKTLAIALIAVFAWQAPSFAATYYVAPNGNDAGSGTLNSPWRSIAKAQLVANPGDTIYFRGGAYTYNSAESSCSSMTATVNAITLGKSGMQDLPIRYWAYPGEKPKFDFSQMTDNCRVKGFNVTGSFLHLKGLEITGAPQQPGNLLNNESWGVWISGSNNIFEFLDIHRNMGPGLFIANGSHNLVLNVDSHHNYDPYSRSGAGQNADGFGVHVPANQPGNVLSGCRAWSNTDDGYDTISADSSVLIENSWAWLHGYLPGTTTSIPAGNGNGFKIGGYGGVYRANAPVHVTRNNVSFRNKAAGFYSNHHPVASLFYNNTASHNRYNYNMLGITENNTPVNLAVLRNNLSILGTATTNMAGTDESHNSWSLPVTVTNADFQLMNAVDGWDSPRLPDGSLPRIPNFRLKAGSDLVNQGIDVGLPFEGSAPDLGAYEGTLPVAAVKDVTASVEIRQSGLTFDRSTQQTAGTISFTNKTGAVISGPLLLRMDYLSQGVTLVNASGTQGGSPTVSLTPNGLAPGATITTSTRFTNPDRVSISYLPVLLIAP